MEQLSLMEGLAAPALAQVYEYDTTMGAMGDEMARNQFNREYARHVAEGWQPVSEVKEIVSQQEMSQKGIMRVGYMVMLLQIWKRPVAPKGPVL